MATSNDTTPHERYLTVSYISHKIPYIRLQGNWLKEAGFVIQAKIRVRVMKECLVIIQEPLEESIACSKLKRVREMMKEI